MNYSFTTKIGAMNPTSPAVRKNHLLRKISLVSIFTFVLGFAWSAGYAQQRIYDFKVTTLEGKTLKLSKFKGKKILVVNTTSVETNNPEYAELEALSKRYKDKLVVIGFLAVDFLKRPGTEDFSPRDRSEYKVSFPLCAQVSLSGPNIAPIYKWLTDVNYNHYRTTEIKWDLQKYLINENGELIAEFDPKIKVTDPRVIQAIEK